MNIPFEIQRVGAVPMHLQLRDQIIAAIEEGRLTPGQRMPSTRVLSNELKVSRVVVVQCYEALTSMGFIVTATGSGSYVRRVPVKTRIETAPLMQPVEQSEQYVGSSHHSPSTQFAQALRQCTYIDTGAVDMSELNYGAASAEHLPSKIWRKIMLNLLLKNGDSIEFDSHPLGSGKLRESICGYIRRARGVNCSPSQIALFSSSQMSLSILFRLLLDEGDYVAVENPGFGHARKLVACCGAELLPIDIDDEGISVDQLRQSDVVPKIVYVTPSHHDPSGVVMSVKRRHELLEWAVEKNVLIIEDDYDSEYRYHGQRLPSIQSLDTHGRVIYLANFWKVLFPYVTMGYLILPPHLVGAVAQAKSCIDRAMPSLEQQVLSKFISSGALERHIHKTKQAYIVLRQELLFSLTRNFAKKVQLAKESSGMHILFSIDSEVTEAEIIKLAHNAGISLVTTRNFYFRKAKEREFLISFARLKKGEIAPRMFMFAASLKQAEQALLGDQLAKKVQQAQSAIFSKICTPAISATATMPLLHQSSTVCI